MSISPAEFSIVHSWSLSGPPLPRSRAPVHAQAVRIPREFELPGEDAIMRKEGDKLIIESVAPRSLLAVLAKLQPIREKFPQIDELGVDHIEL